MSQKKYYFFSQQKKNKCFHGKKRSDLDRKATTKKAKWSPPAPTTLSLGRSPLYRASTNGHFGIVRHLVSHARESVHTYRTGNYTPLFVAAYHGHLEIIQHLVENVPELNDVLAEDGRTALYVACQNGHLDAVRCFVSKHSAS